MYYDNKKGEMGYLDSCRQVLLRNLWLVLPKQESESQVRPVLVHERLKFVSYDFSWHRATKVRINPNCVAWCCCTTQRDAKFIAHVNRFLCCTASHNTLHPTKIRMDPNCVTWLCDTTIMFHVHK
jgi:hypothetical protein